MSALFEETEARIISRTTNDAVVEYNNRLYLIKVSWLRYDDRDGINYIHLSFLTKERIVQW